MVFRNVRRNARTSRKRAPQLRRLEQLECRRLLAGDGDAFDLGPPIDETRLAFAVASGTKWHDANGNGVRDNNESGLAGVTIYADLNNNQAFDNGEPSTVSQSDDPRTRFDEGGRYFLELQNFGTFAIREVVPEGFQQTFPNATNLGVPEDEFASVKPAFLKIDVEPGDVSDHQVAIQVHPFCFRAFDLEVVASRDGHVGVPGVEVINHSGVQTNGCGGDVSNFNVAIHVLDPGVQNFELGFLDTLGNDVIASIPVVVHGDSAAGGHMRNWAPGTSHQELNFGNRRIKAQFGAIEGRKWLDEDGDGELDAGEPGLGGVDIYLDTNNNGSWDRGEQLTRTEYDNPVTDFDEAGRYRFDHLLHGEYVVREIVPVGYQQTYPIIDAVVVSSESGTFARGSALAFDVNDVDATPTDNGLTADVALSVLWPNGCWTTDGGATSHVVIGDTIVLDMQGEKTGGVCTQALRNINTRVQITGLESGEYRVVGTLREKIGPDNKATLSVVGNLRLGPNGSHTVAVESGNMTSDINFGNRLTGFPESISGTKWHDVNGDGRRQDGEPPLSGVTIYVDLDGNQQLDAGEPQTVTDENGQYEFDSLQPGIYTIREVVPDGFRQTFPWAVSFEQPAPEPIFPGPIVIEPPILDRPFIDPIEPFLILPKGGHVIEMRPGVKVRGVDFGNQSTAPASVQGLKWNDLNGNGRRDDGEPGLAGVTVYVDTNFNGRFDENDPHAVTIDDNPQTTDVNELGRYTITGVKPGHYYVNEVVPEGYYQTWPLRLIDPEEPIPHEPFPDPDFQIFPPQNGHFVKLIPNEALTDIDFGNQRIEPGSVRGLKWRDDNGNGTRDQNEPGLAGVTIYADLNFNGQLDENEPSTVTMLDDASTAEDETGRYWIEGLRPQTSYPIREVVPEGFQQTFPRHRFVGPVDILIEPAGFTAIRHDAHFVYVGSGAQIENLDFGNKPVPTLTPDSKLGDDIHGNAPSDATKAEFIGDQLRFHSYLDQDDDIDVFQFVGKDGVIEGEGGRFDGKEGLLYEILNESGDVIAKANHGEPLHAETTADNLYYVRIQGEQGRYLLDMFHLPREQAPPDGAEDVKTSVPGAPETTNGLRADLNGDDVTDFADFLVLSAGFGKDVDAAFADGDINGDGTVTFADFLVMSAEFGQHVG